MKLNGVIGIALILALAFLSEGHGKWTIKMSRRITAVRGSDVTINCTFTCPLEQCQDPVSVYWKKKQKSAIIINDRDGNALIYHTNETYVLEKYKGKTELVPRDNRDCSLKIRSVTENHRGLYVRINTKNEKYSFYQADVSITVHDKNDTSSKTITPTNKNDTSSKTITPTIIDSLDVSPSFPPTQLPLPPESPSSSMYIAIFVPLTLVVIFVIMAGVFFFIKHKRTQSVTREGSGYYANFSRASSNNPKSEVSCKKIDQLPALTDVEDPIYINVKSSVNQTDQSVDHTDNIYANVDYTR